MDGETADGSRFIERRRSAENEARPSLMRSFTTVIDDLRDLVVVLEEVESLLSWMVSFGGCGSVATAFWWSITKGDCLRSKGA